ncbi:RT0821/Lpp0805 family surface protein [Roseibium sp.]|uniref:RT0821/Lpp0805 family surface protein n=1 Tax=Roseibium sp. TaxID=1936156 RepID=UPI003A974AFA
MFHRHTYTARLTKIQSLAAPALSLVLLAGGCGQISMPLGSADVETPLVLTGSIPSASDVAFADVGEDDRKIIAMTLDAVTAADGPEPAAYSESAADENSRLAWTNQESGNSGRISEIDKTGLAETGCVAFKTTANTIAGLKIYSGSACRDISSRMTITSLAAGDA